MQQAVSFEDSQRLGKRHPGMEPPPFACVPHPVDIKPISSRAVDAGEGGVELLAETGDLRMDETIIAEIAAFLRESDVKSVVITEGIVGCPTRRESTIRAERPARIAYIGRDETAGPASLKQIEFPAALRSIGPIRALWHKRRSGPNPARLAICHPNPWPRP
jgi:hypothetical protein